MQTINSKTFIVALGILAFTSAKAHEPSEHKDKAEKPKCEMMGDMDSSKMDSNDPVMQAMMEKCKASNMDNMKDKGMMGDHADDATTTSDHHDKMKDKMKDKSMMDDHADDATTTSDHHDKMKDKMKDKGMMGSDGDESHSDDHD